MNRSAVVRSRLTIVAAVMIAVACVAFGIAQAASSSSGAAPTGTALPTSPASYLGVYETGPPQTYEPVAEFARAAGRQPNLVGYYSGWGERFAAPFAERARVHGAATNVAAGTCP